MQNFLQVERSNPKKRQALERVKDYSEIYQPYSSDEATPQASRCVQCGDPYCHNKCPLHNFIPQWLKKVSEKDFRLAFELSHATSPFPEIMGRVCPQDRLCEGDCTLNDGYGAITIGAIETFISEKGMELGYKPKFATKSAGKSVAIVGSGPAGLSAATFLLREGFKVELFERQDRAGGLLTYGIPGFKLEKSVIERRLDQLTQAGLKLHLGKEIGKEMSFEKLLKGFDAIFLGIGATAPKKARIPGEEAEGCYSAIDFLTAIQKRNFGVESSILLPELKGKSVVVVGGGDTAMDCVRTAIREGAEEVKILYRRDENNMPGSHKEYVNAKEEGVEFEFFAAPKQVILREGKATGIESYRTELCDMDEKGRQKCVVVEGSEFVVEADVIIFSLGFDPARPSFLEQHQIALHPWGGIIVDDSYETSLPNVFAGGDCYRGADLVVNAALDGREAAKAIIKKLLG